jgi:hypothetical protein
MITKTLRQLILPIPSKYDGFDFFLRDELNAELCDRGFVVTSISELAVIQDLETDYQEMKRSLKASLKADFQNTSSLQDNELKKEVKRILMQHATRIFEPLVSNSLQVEPGSFFNKEPRTDSATGLHHDGCHIDEANLCGLHAWLPFQDMNEDNGTFWVVPFSHRIGHFNRVVTDAALLEQHKEELKAMLVPLNIKRGEILFFDHALVHLSGPNHSDQERTAASYTLARKPFQYIYLKHNQANHNLQMYLVDRDFWIDNRPESEKLTDLKPVENRVADDLSLLNKRVKKLLTVNHYLK